MARQLRVGRCCRPAAGVLRGYRGVGESVSPAADDLLDSKEASEYADVSRATLYREWRAGHLHMTKMRSRTRWRRGELDRWLRDLPERRTA